MLFPFTALLLPRRRVRSCYCYCYCHYLLSPLCTVFAIMYLKQNRVANTYEYSVATFCSYEGWNFNSGNYLFTTDTK